MGTKIFYSRCVFCRTKENEETERNIEGVGWDTSIPLKLYFSFRRKRKSVSPRGPHDTFSPLIREFW